MDEWIAKRDPNIMSGELCFTGTRVPVYILFGFLESGASAETFLDDYPSVRAEQVKGVLNASRDYVESAHKLTA